MVNSLCTFFDVSRSMVEGYLFGEDGSQHGNGAEPGFRRMPGTANTNGAGM